MTRTGPRILLIGGTYRTLCVLERLLERGYRVAALIGVEGGGERDFCPEILEICDRNSIPARSGHKLGEEIVRWLEDRIRPELSIAVGVRAEVPIAVGGNCRLGLIEATDLLLNGDCPGVELRQRGKLVSIVELPGLREETDASDAYMRVVDTLVDALDDCLARLVCVPAAARTGVKQDVTGLPSSKTVQARHWPSPQPYLVPVRRRSSRSTSSRDRPGSVVTLRDWPLTVKRYVALKQNLPTGGKRSSLAAVD